MALGGIILYLAQNLGMGGTGSAGPVPIVLSTSEYTVEFRVRFPGPTDTTMAPTELSGALITLSSGSSFSGSGVWSLWYEKPATTSATGNLYLTSSAGRLTMASASIFNDNFYNVAVVRERSTGSIWLYVSSYDEGEQTFQSSSFAMSGTTGCPTDWDYYKVELGSSALKASRGQFWGHEFRMWSDALSSTELDAHARHFESYGRDASWGNRDLLVHWRLADAVSVDSSGSFYVTDSTSHGYLGTGSYFQANAFPWTKSLESYSYIPSIDYGWNQEKVRIYSGSTIDPVDAYHDERFVSLEFNMYDALNEDISHVMSSYDELNNFLGLPINRYREDYEGLRQMRETYFKRLQGQLNFRVFVDMLDFFDSSFISIVERLLPARSLFKGDELVVESHMLERPKYQYQLRPIVEGRIDISGSIAVVDYGDDSD